MLQFFFISFFKSGSGCSSDSGFSMTHEMYIGLSETER